MSRLTPEVHAAIAAQDWGAAIAALETAIPQVHSSVDFIIARAKPSPRNRAEFSRSKARGGIGSYFGWERLQLLDEDIARFGERDLFALSPDPRATGHRPRTVAGFRQWAELDAALTELHAAWAAAAAKEAP